jgi:hypothetical protein
MTKQMTPLRRRMIEDVIRNMSPATQKAYVYAIKNFSAFFRRSPDELCFEQVREYQLRLISRVLKAATINVVVCALRFLYGTTLGRPEVADQVPLARSSGRETNSPASPAPVQSESAWRQARQKKVQTATATASVSATAGASFHETAAANRIAALTRNAIMIVQTPCQ